VILLKCSLLPFATLEHTAHLSSAFLQVPFHSVRLLRLLNRESMLKPFCNSLKNIMMMNLLVTYQYSPPLLFLLFLSLALSAFAAVLSQFVYKKNVSKAKWLCLPIVIGGVILASVNELDFAWSALISACIANMFAAVRGNENKKLMETPGIKDRIGSVGNQFALTSILGFLMSIPFFVALEGRRWPEFAQAFKTNKAVSANLIASGLWFYGYNEVSTMTLKKTGAVTQSVANTAKRVIVIVGVALVLGESLDPLKLIGCAIGIGGVFLYSIIDKIFPEK
jgi:solute carrier family 35 protein E1